MYNENKLLEFRGQKDKAWKNDKESPLSEGQKKNFKGLNYFPPNPDLSFEQFQYYLLFRDQTTGKKTYKNGRMLQIPKKGEKLIIDFNYAYNPYSSYNDNWDCSITPKENILPVEIQAGEKKFI